MGKQFGNLCRVKGVISYAISPYEQRAFAGAKNFLPKYLSMLARNFPNFVPYMIAFGIIDWSNREYDRLIRKDPKLYAEADKEFE